MKKTMFLLLAFAGVMVLAGCSLYGASSTPSTPSTPANNSGTAVAGNAVSIQNFAFNPGTLTVKKGTTVTWTNNDSATHQIKSNTFNSNQLSKGQTFSFTFDNTGTFDYSCAIHPSMKGQIIVQ